MTDGPLKSVAVGTFRALAAPFGRRAVDRLVARGLPQQLAPPLRFLFKDTTSVDASLPATIRTIEAMRDALAARGGGVTQLVNGFASPDSIRPFAEIASLSSVSEEWGTFLHLLARGVGARSIIELGACAGISGCYLASVPSCERFVSMEGSSALARIAAEHLGRISHTAEVLEGLFEDRLDEALARFPSALDLAFVDGHKDCERLRGPVERIVERLAPGGLLVLDDIRAFEGTARLWAQIRESPGFSFAIDVGRFGIGVCDPDCRRPDAASLALYTAWLRRS
jgi:predicted O-methyltransferase YrrM